MKKLRYHGAANSSHERTFMNLAPRTARRLLPLSLLLLLSAAGALPATAAAPSHWVGTWATSPIALPNPDGKYGAADITYREIVHTSIAGDTARVIFTNEFGLDPLTINAASIALRTSQSEINPDTARP